LKKNWQQARGPNEAELLTSWLAQIWVRLKAQDYTPEFYKIEFPYAGGGPVFLLSELLHWTLPDNDKDSSHRLSAATSSNIALNLPAMNRRRIEGEKAWVLLLESVDAYQHL
jgi:hypothetical protein